MRKNARKAKPTRKKMINKHNKKGKGGFESPKVAPRERSNTKGG
jgi:hypothetical protein